MSLMDAAMADVIFMSKTRVPDGEGGFVTAWAEGAAFSAAIVFNNSVEARAAAQQGVKNLYTVTVDKSAAMEYHDVFKRVSDGKIFRITSDGEDAKTPNVATFQFAQMSAEEWVLT